MKYLIDFNIYIEPQVDAQVRVERNGVPVHRRAEVFHQFVDG